MATEHSESLISASPQHKAVLIAWESARRGGLSRSLDTLTRTLLPDDSTAAYSQTSNIHLLYIILLMRKKSSTLPFAVLYP